MKSNLVSLGVSLAVVVAVSAFVNVTGANAAGDAATDRQAVMKNVGAATKAGAGIAKGEVPFDAVTAQLVLRTLNNAALGFGYLFPDGSQTGAKTEASPKIWSDRAGFDAVVAKFVADTSAQLTDRVTDLNSFKAAFGAATSNCGVCHKAYRLKN